MTRDGIRTQIEEIIKNKKLPPERQIEMLRKIHYDLRAQQRAQTESAMIPDPDIGSNLRDVERALESLGAEPVGPEDSGAATL